jgi:hypothetical protein
MEEAILRRHLKVVLVPGGGSPPSYDWDLLSSDTLTIKRNKGKFSQIEKEQQQH